MLEEDLSYAERLSVHRGRQPQGRRNRPTHARNLGLTMEQYHQLELGQQVDFKPPNLRLNGLRPVEVFRVLRLRSGLSVKEIARRLCVTKSTLAHAELDGRIPRKLRDFWLP